MSEIEYDVVIVGAGPAGSCTALELAKHDFRVALLDKSTFPRDKICGDFVAGKGIRSLKEISPAAYERVLAFSEKAANKSTHLYVGNLEPLLFHWTLPSFTIKREHFDHLLLEEALATQKLDFFQGDGLKAITRSDEFYHLTTQKGKRYRTRLVIGADGAHSVVARQLAGFQVDREHYGGSVRAYFTGVQNIQAAINEVYVHKTVVPGYFWLFPLSDTTANVGIGMHSRHITANKVDLKALFHRFIEENPVLKSKLGNATLQGSLSGFGLPFFSKKFTIHGDGFMLTGDAASLIDPTNGEGIELAIVSGQMAAQTAIKALVAQDFSASNLAEYTERVHQKWWKQMQRKALIVKWGGDKYWLIHFTGWLALRLKFLARLLQKQV